MSREHGTVRSYVVGFVLSLIFTAIPYYLVVTQTVTGNWLLGTILGFGVLQMLVQVVFFLHLGRGPKTYWQVGFLVATVGAIFVVVVGSVWIMHHLHTNMTPADKKLKLVEDEGISQIGGEKTGACEGVHTRHKVTIKDGVARPSHVDAHVCDTLTFTNEDAGTRHILFGPHDHHDIYAGEEMLMLSTGRAKMIVLSEPGTVLFRDHIQEETAGSFTVTP